MTEEERNALEATIKARFSKRALVFALSGLGLGGFGGLLVDHSHQEHAKPSVSQTSYGHESQLIRWERWAGKVAEALPPAKHPTLWADAPNRHREASW